LKKWDTLELNVQNAQTSTGATLQKLTLVEIQDALELTALLGKVSERVKKITFAEAWKGFESSFTTARVPCTSIKRYPIVARWRNDVDFVAAGIFCFQPYCVTGELDPPANPLICP